MTIDLQAYPQVPPTTNSLSPKDLQSYVTNISLANFELLKAAVEAIEATNASLPTFTRAATFPDVGKLGDRWVDTTNSYQENICINAYTSGNGVATDWVALRDVASANSVALLANSQSSSSAHLSSLKTSITDMSSDSNLNATELSTINVLKSELEARNTEIISGATIYSLTGETSYTEYTAAYSSWLALPPVPSNPLPANFAVTWNDLLDKEDTILAAIRSAGTSLLNTLNGDVTAIQNTLDDMASDGKITPAEKLRLKTEYTRVQGEYAKFVTLATSLGYTGESQYTTLVASYTALQTYIDTTLALFSNMSETTDIASPATWETRWGTYYLDAKALDHFIDTQFRTEIDNFQVTLDGITASVGQLSDDGVISGGTEKRLLLQYWKDIQEENTRILYLAGNFAVTTPTAYTNAYTALDTYLTTTTTMFDNMESDTAINRATMDAIFDGYRSEYSAFSNTIADVQENQITTGEPADYGEYKTTVDNIATDGVLSAGAEKQRVNSLWLDIQATHANFVNQASATGVSYVGFQAAYDDLETYLGTITPIGGGSPNFTVTNEDSSIGPTTFTSKFRNYDIAKAQLSETITTSLLSTVQDSAKVVADMNNDGVITQVEKLTLKRIWEKYTAERDNAVTQANNLSITTARDAMTTAYTNLDTFMSGMDGGNGLFDDMNSSTTLTTTEQNNWDTNWFDFETKLQALLTEISSTIIGNTNAVSSAAFKHDGSQPATGTWSLNNFKITNLLDGSVTSGSQDVVNGGQLYTEQQARTVAVAAAQSTADTAVANAATAQGTADTAVANAATAQSAADTAQADADTANIAAGTAQSTASSAQAAATAAQTTADTVVASISQSPGSMPFRYVAPTQQGNGSGDSAANAIAGTSVQTAIGDNPAIVLLFAEGSYGNIFGSGRYVGKTIYLINTGLNTTITQGISCENSNLILAVTPGGAGFNFSTGSFAITYNSTFRTVINGESTVNGLALYESELIMGGNLYVDVNSVAQFKHISCGNITAYAGSFIRHSSGGSTMQIAGNLLCEERAHIRSNGPMNIVGTGTVQYDSFVRAQGGFSGTTPTASNGGANYTS